MNFKNNILTLLLISSSIAIASQTNKIDSTKQPFNIEMSLNLRCAQDKLTDAEKKELSETLQKLNNICKENFERITNLLTNKKSNLYRNHLERSSKNKDQAPYAVFKCEIY